MEAELRANLHELAVRYGAARSLELSTVARQALGDWRFFQRLEDSDRASFTIRKYDAAVSWFAGRWPDDAEWPHDVPRPEQAAA